MSVFVGRQPELGALRLELERAADRHPRVVLIEGEAGIGKSTLLGQFCDDVHGAHVLRAAGEQTEQLLTYGIAEQLLGRKLTKGRRDPLAVGTVLLSAIDRAQGRDRVVVVVVDDLHWADEQSAAALLFALRRLVADRVLAVMSSRPGELGTGELGVAGQGWERFVAGDERATRVRLGGLSAADVSMLAESLAFAPLPRPIAARLVEHTGGNPLYCRALLEELRPDVLRRSDGVLPAPKAFRSVLLARLSRLTNSAQLLVTAASVLGERCSLRTAAKLAGLDEPVDALQQAVAAGLLREEGIGASAEVAFSHPLTRAAIYSDLGPAPRRRLHARAAGLLSGVAALSHRVAAATGSDDTLARDLESAAATARSQGQSARAAAWLEQAADLSSSPGGRERLLLEALDVLVTAGDVGRGLALEQRLVDVPESALRGALVGELDLLAGRSDRLEARLSARWEARDPVRDRAATARAAMTLALYLYVAARVSESLVWSERALESEAGDPTVDAICRSHVSLCQACLYGRRGEWGFDDLPDDPSAVPMGYTDALMMRGQAKLLREDYGGSVDDMGMVAARVRAGVPCRYPSQSLGMMSYAEYRLGRWDDAAVHSELAVSLSHDADRAWDFPFVHCMASYVPAARGEWDVASAHVDASRRAAQAFAVPVAVWAANAARVALADARGNHEEVLVAAGTVRRVGHAEVLGRPGVWEWRQNELEAMIALERFAEASLALSELEQAAERVDLRSGRVSAAGLRGRLAAATGDDDEADVAFADAWTNAEAVSAPFLVAWLGLTDGSRLRLAGRRREAIERLQAARRLLAHLGARPYLKRCDAELDACGVRVPGQDDDPVTELTRAEVAVARLVVSGRSNKEVASELFVSVKTVEFHLRHVYQKLGVRSRVALATRLGGRER